VLAERFAEAEPFKNLHHLPVVSPSSQATQRRRRKALASVNRVDVDAAGNATRIESIVGAAGQHRDVRSTQINSTPIDQEVARRAEAWR
jgi:hypothetical protein